MGEQPRAEDEDDDDGSAVAFLPLLPEALTGAAPPEALPGPQPGAAPAQHLAKPEVGPTTGVEHAPQTLNPPDSAVSHHGLQHGPDQVQGSSAQHLTDAPTAHHGGLQPPDAPQHIVDAPQGPDPSTTGHTGLRGPTGRRGIRGLRHLSKTQLAVAAAVTAVVIATGVVIVSARRDDDKAAAPPATTAAVVVATEAVVVTDAPAAAPVATAAPTTQAPTTSTEAPTTTSALPSGSGSYDVALGPTTVSGGGFSQEVASTNTGQWVFSGPCDGVGPCTSGVPVDDVSAANGGGGGLTVDANGNYVFELVPTGGGGYVSNFEIAVPGDSTCGAVTASGVVTVDGLPTGQFSGSYVLTAPGSGDCPEVTISTTFTGSRVG